MLRTRVIPSLLLKNESLIKTKQFKKYTYIGDPCNTVRIFNELEVDEILFLDVFATRENRTPNYNLLNEIASECFMPVTYGGGIHSLEEAKRVFYSGFEKVALNSEALVRPEIITEIANEFGSQSVVVSIDVKKNIWGSSKVFQNGRHSTGKCPIEWAKIVEEAGAGEILFTSVDREGMWNGFDVELIKKVCSSVNIPLIAHGGCSSVEDIVKAVKEGQASAVAVGSFFVFQKKDMGVLINYPCNLIEKRLHNG